MPEIKNFEKINYPGWASITISASQDTNGIWWVDAVAEMSINRKKVLDEVLSFYYSVGYEEVARVLNKNIGGWVKMVIAFKKK